MKLTYLTEAYYKWSDDKTQKIIELWPNHIVSELEEILGVPKKAISNKVEKLIKSGAISYEDNEKHKLYANKLNSARVKRQWEDSSQEYKDAQTERGKRVATRLWNRRGNFWDWLAKFPVAKQKRILAAVKAKNLE